jgi:hypothetical protein
LRTREQVARFLPAWSWSTRGWHRSINGGPTRATPPRRGPCLRTVPWRESPSTRKPGGYLVSACAARSMIALRSSRAPAR